MRRDFHNRKVIVVGAGLSGMALVEYFSRRGASVTLSDRRPEAEIDDLAELRRRGIALDLGGHEVSLFTSADLVVISPGVPLTVPAVASALAAGVPVLGEIEVAFGELDAPLVGVTGTNGKSTTTVLMASVFSAWGKKTFAGGNLGTPMIEAVDGQWDWLVVELSSFQLEAIRDFRPRYGLLLNLSEDHLDRYPDMAAYVAAKMRMFENMTADDVAVLNAEDAAVVQLATTLRSRRVWFSSKRLLSCGMGCDGDEVVWRMDGAEERFPLEQLRLRGEHNVENVMAALIPPLLEGCPPQAAWRAVCAFPGLAHRMEAVRSLDGVTWYNDSKGTNVGSVVKSLAGFTPPVTLIAGGRDKGGDYAPLAAALAGKVAHLILIGEAADRMEAALGGQAHTVRAASLKEAVRQARELTPEGGTVLFSPGCSSFDMFANFAERGQAFTREVRALPEREAV